MLLSRKTITLIILFKLITVMAHAGDDFVDDDDGAKMARLKAQQRYWDRKSDRDDKKDDKRDKSADAACGSLNIGNVVNKRGARGPREVNIIVTGDVINANNKCN